MMKLLVLTFFCLLGLGEAFEVGYQYTYDYYSDIKLGIPEIRNQIAAGGLKAQLIIQMVSRSQAIVKLKDVEVGEFHGYSEKGMREPVQIGFSPVSGLAQMLEEPFEVNVEYVRVGDMMRVSKNEPEYVTNIKKSIAHLFIVSPITEQLLNKGDSITEFLISGRDAPYLNVEGETFFGRCELDYTFYPKRVQPRPDLELDPKMILETWFVRKTINFERCQSNVVMQRNGVSNSTHAGSGVLGTVQTRSSVSNYEIQTTAGSRKFHLLRGHSEGTVILNPFGYKTEKLMSLSNQTMNFKHVEHIPEPFLLGDTGKIVRSWQMEMSSPFKIGSNSPLWVNFRKRNERFPPFTSEASSTGLKITSELIEQFEKEVDQAMHNASKAFYNYPQSINDVDEILSPFDTQESTAASQLDSASRLVRALPVASLEKLLEKYQAQTSEVGEIEFNLFVDVLAASGGGASWDVLLKKMESGEIEPIRAMTTFMTMTNNIVSPEAIPYIAKFIKTLSTRETDVRKFLFTSTAWINFASTIHRVCLDKNSYAYAVPYQVFGDVNCSPSKGVSIMLPFLKEQLQRSTNISQKLVITQAISNLGTMRSLTTLKQIIYGQFGKDRILRSVAIYGLLRHRMTDASKHQIQKVLQPIIDNIEEHLEVRQAAFIVALTWRPADSWWNEMATLSWQDPSRLMGSLIYSTMLSYSRASDPRLIGQSKAAEYALRFAKPYYDPLTFKISSNMIRATYLPRDHMRTFFQSALLPAEFFTYLTNSFGGFEFTLFEIACNSEGMYPLLSKLLEYLQSLIPEFPSQHQTDVSPTKSEDVLERIKKDLGLKKMPVYQRISASYTRFFENIQKFVVLDERIAESLLSEGTEILKQLEKGKRLAMNKFFNPVTSEILIPTQIGLPILTRLSSPTIISNEGEARLNLKSLIRGNNIVDVNLKSNFKYVNKVVTTMRVLLPWTERLVSTGVESLHNINLPFKLGFGVKVNQSLSASIINTTLHMETVYTKEFPVLHFHNLPFTLVKGMWPDCDPSKISLEAVTATGQDMVTKVRIPISRAYTGVDGKLIYGGDAPFPLTLGNMIDLAKEPSKKLKLLASPTSKAFQLVLRVNMGNSATSGLNASVAHEINHGHQPDPIFTHMINGTLLLTGKEQRYYEMNFKKETMKWHNPEENPTRSLTELINLSTYRSPLPNSEYKTSAKYCLSYQIYPHRLYSIESLKQALNRGWIEKDLNGTLSGGEKCQDSRIASFEGNAFVSSPRLQKLMKEVSDPMMRKEIVLANEAEPIYDRATLNITYVENPPQVVVNTSYHIYDLIRGYSFPHIYFNYMNVKNTKQEISLTGTKPMGQHYWNVFMKLPKEDVILDKVSVPRRLQNILLLSNPVLISQKSCLITPDKVKTFDGVLYEHPVCQCWVVSVINLKRPDQEPIVLTRKNQSGQLEAKIYLSKVALDVTKDQLKVNGQAVPLNKQPQQIRSNGMPLATVSKIAESELVVEVPFKLVIVLTKDYVEIVPKMQERGSQGGICGTYSSNLKYQLIGPKLAYYNDTKLFPYAWTLQQGEGCQKEKVSKERRNVEEYQAEYQQYNNKYQLLKEQVPDDGLEYIHAVKRVGGHLCASQLPVGMCAPGRSTKLEKTYSEVYDCWRQEDASETMMKSKRRGYMKDRENRPAEKTMPIETKHDIICSS